MAKFEEEIKDIERILIDLACSGCDVDVNMDDIREMVENPNEFDTLPSDLIDDYLFNVDNMRDRISKLYNKLDKLQDLLYEESL